MQQDFHKGTVTPFTPEKTQARIPYSFWIFALNIAGVLYAIVTSYIGPAVVFIQKNFMLFFLPNMLCFFLLSSGIYAGFTYRSTDIRRSRLNKTGLWGCLAMACLVMILLLFLGLRQSWTNAQR